MTGKIFRNFVFVSFSVLAVSVALILWALYGRFSASLTAGLVQQTDLMAVGVEQAGLAYLDAIDTGDRVTLVAPDGTVLFDNRASAAGMENHADREEIRQALETGRGQAVRRSATISTRTVYVAHRLSDGTVLRVAGAQSTAAAMVRELIPVLALILCAALVLSLLLAFRLSRKIVTPILSIDPEHPEQSRTYDELTPLLSRLSRQNDTIRRQMDELRRRQEEFTGLIEHMAEGIVVLDRTGNLLSCNTAALTLLGAGPERGTAFDLNDSPEFRRVVERALSGGADQTVLERGSRSVQVVADGVSHAGEAGGGVLVLMDVTERENNERLRREFTANVSHELKTPLTSISGMAEIMKSGIVRPEDMAEFAGDIYHESKRLIALVEDIIHLSQLDEGGLMAHAQPVEMLSLCAGVVHRLRHQAEAAQVTLELKGGNFTARGVPGVLEEMVCNLCDNALKYNRPGGSVRLVCDSVRRVLRVEDTGIGIPAEDQSRVFERFYRVDKSRSRQIGGTGLGLSIVKHGAALHDIRLGLTSTPGVGTTVTLDFPGNGDVKFV